MKRIDVVKYLHSKNIKILPLLKGKKEPSTRNGVHNARLTLATYDHINFGVACGSGKFVVDVDPRNGGMETLAEWKQAGFIIPETLTIRTAQGGYHYYLNGNVKNTKFKGIDIISDGKYVVGPTSVVNGVEYTFELGPEDTEIADAPDWIYSLCEKTHTETKERFENDTADLTDLENILCYLDPDMDYDDWTHVGMGIHHTNSGDEGYKLWLRWSRGDLSLKPALKFGDNEKQLYKKWASFNSNGGITAGTIFHMAKDAVDDDLFKNIKKMTEGKIKVESHKSEKIIKTVESESNLSLPVPKHGLLARIYQEFLAKAYEPIPVFALGSTLSVMSALTQSPYIIGGSIRTRSYNLLLGPAGIGKNDYLEITKTILRDVSQRGGNVQLLGEEIRSGQALKSMLADYPTRMLVVDEWTDTLERAYAYKRDTVAYEITTILKTLWGDVRELDGSRKRDKSESIKNIIEPRISILGTGVPNKFLELMENNSFISDGLMSRVELWIYNESKPFKNRREFKSYAPSDDLIRDLTALFIEPMDNGVDVDNDCKIIQKPRSRLVEITNGAHDLIDKEFKRVNELNIDTNERSIVGRLLERMKTYAGLHAVGRNSLHVTELDLEYFAVPLFRYQLERTMKLVSKQKEADHLKEVKLVLKHIPRNESGISAGELVHKSKAFRSMFSKMPDRKSYLELLASQKYIEILPSGRVRLLTVPSI